MLGRFILKETIFVNSWYSCSIEQTSILGHIQWKSLQFNKATGIIYIMHLSTVTQQISRKQEPTKKSGVKDTQYHLI